MMLHGSKSEKTLNMNQLQRHILTHSTFMFFILYFFMTQIQEQLKTEECETEVQPEKIGTLDLSIPLVLVIVPCIIISIYFAIRQYIYQSRAIDNGGDIDNMDDDENRMRLKQWRRSRHRQRRRIRRERRMRKIQEIDRLSLPA